MLSMKAQLLSQVKATKARAEEESTINGFKNMVKQIQTYMEVPHFEEDVMIRRPSTEELEVFLQHKRNLNPDCNVESLSHFRAPVRKFADLSPHTEDYNTEELKDIKRFLGGMKNTNASDSSKGIRRSEPGKRHLKVLGK